MQQRWRDGEVAYDDRSRERTQSVVLVGLARIPSYFDPGRYQRMRPDSSGLAWLLGAAGLVVPPLSIPGVLSAYRATRRGNRLGAVAAIWCVLTATVSVVLWAPVFTGAPTPSPSSFALDVTNLDTDATPPAELGFASTKPATHYAGLELRVTNKTSEDVPLSPSSIEVEDGSGRRLAWATTDDTFLATTHLAAGASTEVRVYVALPVGASMASMSVDGAQFDL